MTAMLTPPKPGTIECVDGPAKGAFVERTTPPRENFLWVEPAPAEYEVNRWREPAMTTSAERTLITYFLRARVVPGVGSEWVYSIHAPRA